MLNVAVLTEQGTRKTTNEDRAVVGHCVVGSKHPDTAMFSLGLPSIVAVLDGLGGQPAGEMAASLAANVLASGSSRIRTERNLVEVVNTANRLLYSTMFSYRDLVTMGTAVAGVFARTDSVTVFHVGVSRVYFHDGEHLTQLTVDDSRKGYITKPSAGNALTNLSLSTRPHNNWGREGS